MKRRRPQIGYKEMRSKAKLRKTKANVDVLKTKLKGFCKLNIPDKLCSETYDVFSCSIENISFNYKNDFVYRLLFYTRQLMVTVVCIHRNKDVYDKEISKEANTIQNSIFKNLENTVFEAILFNPEDSGSDKFVPVEHSKLLAKNLYDHILFSKSCYHFVFNILNIIRMFKPIRILVKRMIPESKWITFLKLISEIKPVNYEMNPEVRFNKIHDTIEDFRLKYMTNFGMLITEKNGITYF